MRRRCLSLQASYAIAAGVEFLQIREPDLPAAELSAIVEALLALARGSRTRVLVNDRVDVALACRADGVHLRADSVPPRAVRALAPSGFVVGRSVHTVDEAVAAEDVDYLIAGTVWPTSSKPADRALIGLEGLRAIVSAARVPVAAIGGVEVERLADIQATGAAGAAAIGLFLGRIDEVTHCRARPLDGVAEVRARIAAAR